MSGKLGAIVVHDHDGRVPAHDHVTALRIRHHVALLDLHRAFESRLKRRLVRDLGARHAAQVERAHGELRARLADGLGRDDTDGFAHVDRRTAGQIAPVALAANAVPGFAGQSRANADFLNPCILDGFDVLFLDQFALLDDDLAGGRVLDGIGRGPAQHALAERHGDFAGVENGTGGDTALGAAILFGDDAVLRHVDKAAGQITRVGGLQGGVGETLTGAMGGVEVLHHRQAFLKVRDDRRLDDLTRRLGHQTAHTGKLLHLSGRTARTGMRHHVDRVDRLLAAGLLVHLHGGNALHHFLGNEFGALGPGVDHLVVLLAPRDQAVIVLLLVLAHEFLRLVDDRILGLGDDHVVLAKRDAGPARIAETEAHDLVAKDDRLLLTAVAVDHVDHVGDRLLGQKLIDLIEAHLRTARQQLAEQHTARRGVVDVGDPIAVFILGDVTPLDLAVQRHGAGFERVMDLSHVAEDHPLARFVVHDQRQVIEAEHDILRRHDDWRTVGRMQDVVGRHHQHARFELCFERQRHVDGHLVAVEVGVERRADERMQLNGLALDEHRLESLDAQAVQRRRAVQEHRMLADHLVEDIPDFRLLLLHQLLCLLDRRGMALRVQARIDERLEQLERHLLRQAALMQL